MLQLNAINTLIRSRHGVSTKTSLFHKPCLLDRQSEGITITDMVDVRGSSTITCLGVTHFKSGASRHGGKSVHSSVFLSVLLRLL